MIDKIVKEHTILGIDPGTTVMGYAIIHTSGTNVELVDMGTLDLHKMESHYQKLQQIFFFIVEKIETFKPSIMSIETQFVDKNVQTMLKLAHGQGVAIAAALSKDVPIAEYSPMKIKMAITGNGHATKQQVADMLQRMLKLTDEQMPDKLDATDALAIAYCHFLQLGSPLPNGKNYKGWSDFVRRNPSKLHNF